MPAQLALRIGCQHGATHFQAEGSHDCRVSSLMLWKEAGRRRVWSRVLETVECESVPTLLPSSATPSTAWASWGRPAGGQMRFAAGSETAPSASDASGLRRGQRPAPSAALLLAPTGRENPAQGNALGMPAIPSRKA